MGIVRRFLVGRPVKKVYVVASGGRSSVKTFLVFAEDSRRFFRVPGDLV